MSEQPPQQEAIDKVTADLRDAHRNESAGLDNWRNRAEQALTQLAAVLNVCDDEDYHVGGAWGDYGEIVVAVGDIRKAAGLTDNPRPHGADFAVNNRDLRAAAVDAEANVAALTQMVEDGVGESCAGSLHMNHTEYPRSYRNLREWATAARALLSDPAASSEAWLRAHDAEKDAEITRLRGVMTYLCQEGCTMSGNCSEEFGDDEDSWCEVCVMRTALAQPH